MLPGGSGRRLPGPSLIRPDDPYSCSYGGNHQQNWSGLTDNCCKNWARSTPGDRRGDGYSAGRVREIMKIARSLCPWRPIGEEEDSHLGTSSDEEALAPADAASFILLKEQLEEGAETLTPGRGMCCACGLDLLMVGHEH